MTSEIICENWLRHVKGSCHHHHHQHHQRKFVQRLLHKDYSTQLTQLNSTRGWLNKGKEARKLKNIPDSLNDSQVFFWKYP